MSIISSLASIVSFVVGIMVLIKLFQKEGVLKGILGIICMLYTYIWGWMHAKEQNITNLMWIWTGVIVLSIIVAVVFGGAAAGGGGGDVPTPTGMLVHFFGI
ncbi:MAG: hypothetical protein WA821_10810 [Anaerolineales bacterium]